MDRWLIMDGTHLVSKADLADIVKQVKDKTSDLYSDKPAPFWMSQHLEENKKCGLAHGNLVCYCHLCLMDVAKADTFVAANIDRSARKRIMSCTEDEKFDILTEYFNVSMCSETRTRNVSAALSTLCPKVVGVSAKQMRRTRPMKNKSLHPT